MLGFGQLESGTPIRDVVDVKTCPNFPLVFAKKEKKMHVNENFSGYNVRLQAVVTIFGLCGLITVQLVMVRERSSDVYPLLDQICSKDAEEGPVVRCGFGDSQ